MPRAKRPKTNKQPPKKFVPAKGSGNGKGFEPGHKKSVGNRGAEFFAVNRFMTAAIRNKLVSIADQKTRHMVMHRIVDKLFEIALEGDEDGKGCLQAITQIIDRVEGTPVRAVEISGPEKGPIETITAETSLEELADKYGEMIGAQAANGHDD